MNFSCQCLVVWLIIFIDNEIFFRFVLEKSVGVDFESGRFFQLLLLSLKFRTGINLVEIILPFIFIVRGHRFELLNGYLFLRNGVWRFFFIVVVLLPKAVAKMF